MPLRQESYFREKDGKRFLGDALTSTVRHGELVYSSKGANFFMNVCKLKDKKTGLYYGFIFSLLKVNEENIEDKTMNPNLSAFAFRINVR